MSTVDNYFWTDTPSDAVVEAGVIHSVDNPSDHSPIYCILDNYKLKQNKVEVFKSAPKPSRKRASEEQKNNFKSKVDNKLASIYIPKEISECCDVGCNNLEHRNIIDTYVEIVLESLN